MRFVNELHPELVIADLGVRFTNGQVEVDAKTAAALRKLPPELGVKPVDGPPAPVTKGTAASGRRES